MTVGQGGADQGHLDLADAITLLRDQLAEAQARIADPAGTGARHRGLLFGVDGITLELGLELTRTRGAHGGLRFAVASLGGKQDSATTATHKVTLTLDPRLPDGGTVDVGDEE